MTIKWGIIGCGNVTEVKSGPAFYKCDGSELIAVMRRDADKAADYAKRHNVPKWYANADELINDDAIDAVYVATPVSTHHEYAMKIAAAGKPAYIEKPFTRNFAEAQAIVSAFEAINTPIFVAYYRRALPRFVKAKQLVDEGAIGQLTGVHYLFAAPRFEEGEDGELPWRLQAEHSGGGLFMDLGSYTLDIIDFICGPIVKAEGFAANLASSYDVEDSISMSFVLANGALGHAAWNFASAMREDMIRIMGTEGEILLSTFGEEPVRLNKGLQEKDMTQNMAFGKTDGISDNANQSFDLPNPPHVQQPLIQSICDDLLGNGTCLSTGTSAMRTAQIMDQVLTSYYGDRQEKFWLKPEAWPGKRK